ncbi:MAG: helix-turn-helix domain-containing protein [Clostridiales bacterium]|jgi:two-component system response regulator YesN|nr:helix-turn-helix domain-containing protein [Clostridiales bacterium]
MLKLLILDTDQESVRNFRTYLRMSFPSIKNVSALSSSAGLDKAMAESAPDLIIADIRFFGAAGKKIIQDVSKTYTNTKFILYGSYNDAEYLKNVTEYGVLDFMYRPVKPLDFKRCMEHAIRFFDNYYAKKRRDERVVVDYRREMPMFKEKFLHMLIEGGVLDDNEILSSFKYFGFRLKSVYTVFVARIDKFKQLIRNIGEAEKHLMVYKVNCLIADSIARKGYAGFAFIPRFNCGVCVFSENLEFEELMELCSEIIADSEEKLNIKITIGLGRTYGAPSQISVSYREALSALQYRFYMGRGVVIPIHYMEPNNRLTYKRSPEKEGRLARAAVIGEYEYCESMLRQIADDFESGGGASEKLVHRFVMELMFSIGRYAMEQDETAEYDVTSFFSVRDALSLKTAREAIEYLSGCLRELCAYTQQIRKERNIEILETAQKYIEENYYENITLAKLALRLKTTSEFLNRLFMDSDKMSCYDYIVRVRIDAAKRLFKNLDMTDNVIALKIGYDDAAHFRGVFKQLTGMATNEYRAMLAREKENK